jgi:WD40 repeat protein
LAEEKQNIEFVPNLGHSQSVISAAFSSDGSMVLTGGGDGSVKLWDKRTGRVIRTVKFGPHTEAITTVTFSANSDGRFVPQRSTSRRAGQIQTARDATIDGLGR